MLIFDREYCSRGPRNLFDEGGNRVLKSAMNHCKIPWATVKYSEILCCDSQWQSMTVYDSNDIYDVYEVYDVYEAFDVYDVYDAHDVYDVWDIFDGYSRVPNRSRVWNNAIGWKISPKLIVVGGGINVLGGKSTQNW